MSQQVPTAAVASQTLSLNLDNQACQIALYTLGVGSPDAVSSGAKLYFDLQVGGQYVVRTRICRNLQRILLDAGYQGFQGDFVFIDTQGDTDPTYLGLGVRYFLVFFSADELTAGTS